MRREDPVHLVFDAHPGAAVNATVVDQGDRFRLIVNPVRMGKALKPLPKLPVARAVWRPEPDLETSAAAWIQAGGAHHTAFSYDVSADQLRDIAALTGVEFVRIG